MKNKFEAIKESISENLTEKLTLEHPKIQVISDREVYVSNHKGIIEYGLEKIKINTIIGVIQISGSDMELKAILIEEIIIYGKISKIEILN